MKRNITVSFIFTTMLLLVCPRVFAADILKVKGANVLINLSGESAASGDMFYAIDSGGKKRAIIQIAKVKGDKAIGRITKGRADVGMTLQRRGAGSGGGGGGGASGGSGQVTASRETTRAYWGFIAGYAMDSMSVQVNYPDGTELGDASLSGSGFSINGLFDYRVFPQVWFRGMGGLENFNVSGTSECATNNQQTCNAQISYLDLDFLGRYLFLEGGIRPWVGAGVGLMFPLSKSATALDTSSISATTVIMASGGADFFLTQTMYVPISIEYGLLPKSSEVQAQWIELRAGLAFPF